MQLEKVYLMNVVLYLPLKDVFNFVCISKNTQSACSRLKTNPIDKSIGSQQFCKIVSTFFKNIETLTCDCEELKLIGNSLDKLENIYLTERTQDLKYYNVQSTFYPKIRNFIMLSQYNSYELLSSLENIKEINIAIFFLDRVDFMQILKTRNIEKITIKVTDQFDSKICKPDYYQCINDLSHSFPQSKIYIKVVIKEFVFNNKKLFSNLPSNVYPYMTILSHDVPLEKSLDWIEKFEDKFNTNNYSFFEKHYLNDVTVYRSDFENVVHSASDYNPITLNLTTLQSVENIKFDKSVEFYNKIVLPGSTKKLDCEGDLKVINWDDLQNLERIDSYYSTNTPQKFWDIEHYKYNNNYTKSINKLLVGFTPFFAVYPFVFLLMAIASFVVNQSVEKTVQNLEIPFLVYLLCIWAFYFIDSELTGMSIIKNKFVIIYYGIALVIVAIVQSVFANMYYKTIDLVFAFIFVFSGIVFYLKYVFGNHLLVTRKEAYLQILSRKTRKYMPKHITDNILYWSDGFSQDGEIQFFILAFCIDAFLFLGGVSFYSWIISLILLPFCTVATLFLVYLVFHGHDKFIGG
ncbi:hypothetical protein EIN_329760 [Entamoeba invadens IP1]|uniref:F-box domain-containing protein n=1 Tax=Entamoeba invadens IP1 TaxID=370355 RepID=A0A0A1TXV5_ENTIV|nr:hypothetical protein EIN_329760 [Entamoeba invadens IP1]ELP86199.1 hypothetical protein EIN_329760 [Entamoeba invadens IP1]|eukprot:XP_004185545.1 hypothetical protein EIN_329760 [Entamoeba invadens IP1]